MRVLKALGAAALVLIAGYAGCGIYLEAGEIPCGAAAPRCPPDWVCNAQGRCDPPGFRGTGGATGTADASTGSSRMLPDPNTYIEGTRCVDGDAAYVQSISCNADTQCDRGQENCENCYHGHCCKCDSYCMPGPVAKGNHEPGRAPEDLEDECAPCGDAGPDCGLYCKTPAGTICGDGKCDEGAGENCLNCKKDCGECAETCGDHHCKDGETCTTCPVDCCPLCDAGTP